MKNIIRDEYQNTIAEHEATATEQVHLIKALREEIEQCKHHIDMLEETPIRISVWERLKNQWRRPKPARTPSVAVKSDVTEIEAPIQIGFDRGPDFGYSSALVAGGGISGISVIFPEEDNDEINALDLNQELDAADMNIHDMLKKYTNAFTGPESESSTAQHV